MKISNSFTQKNRLNKKYKIFVETNLEWKSFQWEIDWTNWDLHFNLRLDIWRLWRIKTIYNRKIFQRGLLFSRIINREIFSDLFLLLYQILLADGDFFYSGRSLSEHCVFKNSDFSNNNDCSLMICFLSVLLEESRN